MTRTARSAAVATLAALAAIVAIIAADFATPASAQSEDEATGRIVARLLDDGRVEFGWQPSGGARVLPTKRYFPANIDHNRWLRSSPVEVDGAEIGRINARQSEDGRIEFAFTPTDGQRISPQARYFPTGARVGRWLRSTEIAIGPTAPRYIAVSAGDEHTCAIRESGTIECWGRNDYGQTDVPEGRFTAVSAGWGHTCAIHESGGIMCWGLNGYWAISAPTDEPFLVETGKADAPEGNFIAVSAGDEHTCAIRESGGLECWGWSAFYANAPAGRFSAVSADNYTCVIRDTGEGECWGRGVPYDVGQTDVPDGTFTTVSAGEFHACAIRESGEITCWGSNYNGQGDAPEGSYTTVSAGQRHSCAIGSENGAITCWGTNWHRWFNEATGEVNDTMSGQTTPLEGSFTAVSAGDAHTCAIRESGEIACWGWNEYGQAAPPD